MIPNAAGIQLRCCGVTAVNKSDSEFHARILGLDSVDRPTDAVACRDNVVDDDH
jgi:hypothetical protein